MEALFFLFFILVFLGPPIIYTRYRMRPRRFHRDYIARRDFIERIIDSVQVRFYSLNPSENSRWNFDGHLGDHSAVGIYAIISADHELKLKNTETLFDEVRYDPGERWVFTGMKKGIFIGEPEMKKFLDAFDELIITDLSL